MSLHYLIDSFSDDINDVVVYTGLQPTLVVGNHVVRVADDISVQNPSNLSSLLTMKYAGILAGHALFSNIVYDDMLDATGINTASPSTTGVVLGKKGLVGLFPETTVHTPSFVTVMQGLASTPSQALLVYELFEYLDTDNAGSAFVRYYSEVDPDVDVTVEVSFNNGATFVPTTDQSLLNIPVLDQGNQAIVRFTRATDVSARGRVFVGSWALLY